MPVDYVANFMTCDLDPAAWASAREAEGWPVLGCADHLWSAQRPFPHVWVTLATMAAATSRATLTSSFANNLLRSPVEFAQASLQMQQVSGGRFEAGLGAGWTRDEAVGAGLAYPEAGERAARYIEAITIVRELLRNRKGTFSGAHYTTDVVALGPNPTAGPPPLVASLGGARTIRNIAPLVDRVELKMISAATRNGSLDLSMLAGIPRSHVSDLVAKVREVNEHVPLGLFVLCSVGDDARTKAVAEMLDGTFLGGFYGEAAKVAEHVQGLADLGISRAQLSPFNDEGFELLAPHLFSR